MQVGAKAKPDLASRADAGEAPPRQDGQRSANTARGMRRVIEELVAPASRAGCRAIADLLPVGQNGARLASHASSETPRWGPTASWRRSDLSRPPAVLVAVLIGVIGSLIAAGVIALLRKFFQSKPSIAPRSEYTTRMRTELINTVRTQRIVNGLDRSLGHTAEMNLDLRDATELVKLSYRRTPADGWKPATIEQAYDQAGGELVIVGPPGGGKTTQALRLIRTLLERADAQQGPIPELFVLASWARQRQPLQDWLAEEIRRRHGYPLAMGKNLIFDHQIVAVLDGLDEVAVARRPACIAAINEFWSGHRRGPLVVCSRTEEYEALSERLNIGAVVAVEPPNEAEIERYLAAAGPRWEAIRESIRHGEGNLRELLCTPLMLAVAVLAYRDHDPGELREKGATRATLWSRYVSEMQSRDYDPFPNTPRYSDAQVRHWLGWLAAEMRGRSQSELWVPECIGSPTFQVSVRLAISVTVALLIIVPYWLANGASFALIFAPALGLVTGLAAQPLPLVRTHLNLRAKGSGIALALGLGFGIFSAAGLTALGAVFGLAFGLGIVLPLGMLATSTRQQHRDAEAPTDTYRASPWIGLAAMIVVGLDFGLFFEVGPGPKNKLMLALGTGLAAGLAAGLRFGLGNVVMRISWRWFHLRRADNGPFQWSRFLDWCCDHQYLQSAGSIYQWIHLELRDYLAKEGIPRSRSGRFLPVLQKFRARIHMRRLVVGAAVIIAVTVAALAIVRRVEGRPPKAKQPDAIAIIPDGTTAYVANMSDDTVTPINLATGRPGTSIPVGTDPDAIAITPDGATAYVANGTDNTVTPINLATGRPGTSIPVGTGPDAIAITRDGATAYVANGTNNTVTPIILATGRPGTSIPVGMGPVAIAITPDGATAYVANGTDNTVTPINLATGKPGQPIPVGGGLGPMLVFPGGTPFPLGPGIDAIAITPNGATAYVANGTNNVVTPINLTTGRPGSSIPVGTDPDAIAITPDGATAYVADAFDDTVTPIIVATSRPIRAVHLSGKF